MAPLALTNSRLKTITGLGQGKYACYYGFVKFEENTKECHCRMRVRLLQALVNIRAGKPHSCYVKGGELKWFKVGS